MENPEINIQVERVSDFQINPTVTEANSPLIEELQPAIEDVSGTTIPIVGMLGQSDTCW